MKQSKVCTRCRRRKSVTKFGVNNACADRLNIYCLDCSRTKTRAWLDANPERIKAWAADYRDKHRTKLRAYHASPRLKRARLKRRKKH